jgi:DNA mismatch repair protein MutL
MDIINVLPDSIANQIAAGEVIQRPMSVVKELIENSIDAGAQNIVLNLWDAGKTEIQIVDDGKGMSPTDTRLSIERHATSKIRETEDLFQIATMGFRGEALASIASISHLEIKTRRAEDEVGTCLKVEGSKVVSQEPDSYDKGSSFSVKNLFFNVPARRNFLKSNNAELKHITNIFNRIILCYPEISFKFFSNGKLIYNLPKTNLKQRIINCIGPTITSKLVDIKTETSIINVRGYITKPEYAKKSYGEQYFFINGRYMKHSYFHKAVMNAYDRLLKPNTIPAYYIYFETDPKNIDVNVHPTKTEIKFRDEQSIFQILQATIKESLGKFNLVDMIDFEEDRSVSIPVFDENAEFEIPSVEVDESYNPFNQSSEPAPVAAAPKVTTQSFASKTFGGGGSIAQSKMNGGYVPKPTKIDEDWEKLYESFDKKVESSKINTQENKLFSEDQIPVKSSKFLQLKNRYIVTTVKSGLMVIDQKRAKERILFEELLRSEELKVGNSQNLLYPKEIKLTNAEFSNVLSIISSLNNMGFDISAKENNTLEIKAIPTLIKEENVEIIINQFIERIDSVEELEMIGIEFIAENIARLSSSKFITPLREEDMEDIFTKLFACSNPNYTNSGNVIIKILSMDELLTGF